MVYVLFYKNKDLKEEVFVVLQIISIPFNDPTYNTYKDISQLPTHVFDEMKHFFAVYKTLEEKETAIDEVRGVLDAVSIIEDAIIAYNEKFSK